MIDIHNHILFGVDDGSKSIEESIGILKKAKEQGITDIIITPHFVNGTNYQVEVEVLQNKLNNLKNEAFKENINIKLYLGNEVFIEYNLLELLKNNKFTTLNNSRYLLFEFSMNNFYQGIYDLLFNLRSNKIIPVIILISNYIIPLKKRITSVFLIHYQILQYIINIIILQ